MGIEAQRGQQRFRGYCRVTGGELRQLRQRVGEQGKRRQMLTGFFFKSKGGDTKIKLLQHLLQGGALHGGGALIIAAPAVPQQKDDLIPLLCGG